MVSFVFSRLLYATEAWTLKAEDTGLAYTRNGVGCIKEVTLRGVRLVPRWVIIFGKPARYATSRPGELSLLPYTGREMSTGQSAVMLSGCGATAGWLIPYLDKRVGGG